MLASLVILCGLLFTAALFGPRLFPHTNKILATLFGLLTLLAAQSIFQTIWYYADGRLGHTSDLISLVGAILVIAPWSRTTPVGANLVFAHGRSQTLPDGGRSQGSPLRNFSFLVTLIPALIAASFVLWHAYHAGTTDAIRTPWPLLPHGTIAALVLVALAAWLTAWRSRRAALTAGLSALAILSITLIAPLVYKLGFGFDGFLHRASEQILAATGTLTPKPPYYLGQYVFVTWLARLFETSIGFFDIYLVPIAASLLPLAALLAFPSRQRAWAVALCVSLLPLSIFIVTTPQSFAYILGLVGIFCALSVRTRNTHWLPALLLAGWSVATHPLAGLPFLGAVVTLLWIEMTRRRITRYSLLVTPFLILATAVSIPFAFYLNSLRSAAPIAWNFSGLLNVQTYLHTLSAIITAPTTHIALWADWAATVSYLFPFALLLCALVAAIRDEEHRAEWIALLGLALAMFVSGFVLQTTGEFTFLIDYERGNYAERLFLIANLFLLAPALAGGSILVKRVLQRPATNIATFFLFLAAWTGAQFYLALPRHDATIVGHGWSVGSADQEAVRWIDRDAAGKPYTVLANQSVSAAAVEAFGFKRYATSSSTEPIFFYPIPTGGPLYNVYLQAVGSEPTRDIIKEAATLGQSETVYVVLNDYWWEADTVAGVLHTFADRTYEIQNGKVRIYQFDFSKDKNFSR